MEPDVEAKAKAAIKAQKKRKSKAAVESGTRVRLVCRKVADPKPLGLAHTVCLTAPSLVPSKDKCLS